jgi:hypothetical protein
MPNTPKKHQIPNTQLARLFYTLSHLKPNLHSAMKNKDLFKNMPYMSPLTNRMDASKQKGFTDNFEVISATTLIDHETKQEYAAKNLTIVNHYRFEGMSDPGDNTILYEITTSDGAQGILVTPYGPDCPAHVADFVANIPLIEKQHAGSSPDTTHAQTPTETSHAQALTDMPKTETPI